MDTKNYIGLLVGLMVSSLILVAVVPIFTEVSATEDTFENDGYFHLTKYTADDSVTLEWDATAPDTFTINGEELTYHNGFGLTQSIVLGETLAARLNDNNTRISFYSGGNFVNTSETYPTLTITYSGGTVVATNENTTRTVSNVAELYVISEKGDYVMKKATSPAYLNSGSEIIADSEIYASGLTYSGNNNVFWHLEGTIDDMEYPNVFNENLTVTNESIHGTYDRNHNDLYVLDNLTFTITNTSEVTFDVTASYFVVPSEVTAEKTYHGDTAFNSIIDILPMLAGVGLLMAGVYYFISRK